MNETIAQLAEQAAQESAVLPNDTNLEVTFDDKTYSVPATFIEKFAELIVRNCIQVVDDTTTENQEMNIGLVMASAALVAHFGVEE